MTAHITPSLPANSFRPEFAAGPVGFRTPSPPADALEPLTPPPWPLTQPQHHLPSRKKRRFQEPPSYGHRLASSLSSSRLIPPQSTSAPLPYPSSTSAPPGHASLSHPSHPSPTALDVFAAVATSPALSQSPFTPSLPDQRPSSSHRHTSGMIGATHSRHASGAFHPNSAPASTSNPRLAPSIITRDSVVDHAELLLNFSKSATNYRQHWTLANKYSDGLPNKSAQQHTDYSYKPDDDYSSYPFALHSTWPPKEPVDAQKKPRVHKGWPKGKPRGKRNATNSQTQPKKPTGRKPGRPGRPPTRTKQSRVQKLQNHQPSDSAFSISFSSLSLPPRPKSANGCHPQPPASRNASAVFRGSSVPLDVPMIPPPKSQKPNPKPEPKISICSVCNSSAHPNGYHDLWIICNGCKNWFHTICVGFKTEREVRDVDKFYCSICEPEHGKTTFVRKSSRAHVAVDYAGLNEGQIRAPPDSFEHHFIKPIKEGTLNLLPEKFPRIAPELLTADFFERSGTISEPVVVPAALNPRPWHSSELVDARDSPPESKPLVTRDDILVDEMDLSDGSEDFDYDCVPDDGQDHLDMVMPKGLTVRRVAEILGPERPLQVIDTKSQDSGDNTWSLGKWADYYEAAGEKPVRNVISLEVSQTILSRLVRRPKVVRDLDLTDQVWPKEELDAGSYPHVQYYCLMSVADCFTDFHIDFGGSSVFYHILQGKKTFFFIPPKKQHLKKYEEWCVSPSQASIWLGDVTKECYRVDLSEGDTMLIPSGWIHAVWTPETSLVIGGNFLTRMHYSMQLQVNEIEKNTGVARMFRYPSFQKVHWYAVLQYLQQDPIPSTVVQILYEGGKFHRANSIYLEADETTDENPEYFNARYYSQGEVEGLGDVLTFIFRTVMISIGKIPMPKPKQEAVVRSLPKGHGDHLELLKTFALWVAWKRGNEILPTWAHQHAPTSELDTAMAEKKLGAPIGNGTADTARQPKRRGPKRKELEPKAVASQAAEPEAASDESKDPDTLIHWCRACKRGRQFCLHRDPNQQSDIPPRLGIRTIMSMSPASPVDSDVHMLNVAESPDAHVALENDQMTSGANIDPHFTHLTPPVNLDSQASANASHARIKACEECRKSKRRCVHDASGNIDPVKAMQNPVPRAFSATKRIRQEKAVNGLPPAKRIKTSPIDGEDWPGSGSASTSVPSKFGGPSLPIEEEQTASGSVTHPDAQQSVSSNSQPNLSGQTDFSNQVGSVQVINPEFSRDNIEVYFGNFSEPDGISENTPYEVLSTDLTLEQATNPKASTTIHDSEPDLRNRLVEIQNPVTKVADVPHDQSETDTRSRTPSVRVQTTSTESVDRSVSPPTSPLTDMDHDSPASNHKLERIIKQAKAGEQQVKALNPDAASSSLNFLEDPSVRASPSKILRKTPSTKSTAKLARNNPRKAEAASTLSPREGIPSPLLTAIAETPAMKLEAISPIEETQADESLRLARELQEQEFGLRRRRSSKS